MPVFDLDFTGDTTETVESGGKPPVGCYLCNLEDVRDDQKDSDKTIFEWVIVQGYVNGKLTEAFNGKRIFDRIEQPHAIEREEARGFAISKIKIRAHRLGLWDGESAMKSIDFTEAIGERRVIELGARVAKDGAYKGQEFVEPKFDGVYQLDHKKCPAVWKQTAIAPANPTPTTPAAPAAMTPTVPTTPAAPAPAAGLWEGL